MKEKGNCFDGKMRSWLVEKAQKILGPEKKKLFDESLDTMVQSNYDFDSILDLTKFFVLSPIERKYIQSIEAEIRESVPFLLLRLSVQASFKGNRTDSTRKSPTKGQKSRNNSRRKGKTPRRPSTKRTRGRN